MCAKRRAHTHSHPPCLPSAPQTRRSFSCFPSTADPATHPVHHCLPAKHPRNLLLEKIHRPKKVRNHHSVHFMTHQSFAFYYRLPCMGRINVSSEFLWGLGPNKCDKQRAICNPFVEHIVVVFGGVQESSLAKTTVCVFVWKCPMWPRFALYACTACAWKARLSMSS